LSVCVLTLYVGAQDTLPSGRFNYAELAKVPERARSRKNPVDGDANAVLVGKKLFAQHCTECHGTAGEGSKKAPSLRADEVQQAAPGALFWILTNGVVRRGMPVWSKLPEPQRWAVVSYIKRLKTSQSPKLQAGTGSQ
jgi:mono/diheme cytochrome c family protein